MSKKDKSRDVDSKQEKKARNKLHEDLMQALLTDERYQEERIFAQEMGVDY